MSTRLHSLLPVKNVEFKARCPDLQAVRERLEGLGVPLDRRMRQVDTYFNVSSGRLKLREIDSGEAHTAQPKAAA